MKTMQIKVKKEQLNQKDIEKAGAILKQGGLVAFPTETVYGLGASALDERAAKKTYAAKGRPSDNPLIIHIADYDALAEICQEIPEVTRKLADAFWPGPLTLILKKSDRVPFGTTGGLKTVAVRMPSHPVALALIRAAGGYVSAPSANTSGRPSPTLAEHVAQDLDGKIDLILDGGPVEIGVESTILDLTVLPPMILRPGAITAEMLEKVVGAVSVDQTLKTAKTDCAPRAPGMKYRHYAPKASLTIVEGSQSSVIKRINQESLEKKNQGYKVGIIATRETATAYQGDAVKNIGSQKDESEIAKNLYRILREFDEEKVDFIFSEAFDQEGIGKAIMNRLGKAAGHRVIQVKKNPAGK